MCITIMIKILIMLLLTLQKISSNIVLFEHNLIYLSGCLSLQLAYPTESIKHNNTQHDDDDERKEIRMRRKNI